MQKEQFVVEQGNENKVARSGGQSEHRIQFKQQVM